MTRRYGPRQASGFLACNIVVVRPERHFNDLVAASILGFLYQRGVYIVAPIAGTIASDGKPSTVVAERRLNIVGCSLVLILPPLEDPLRGLTISSSRSWWRRQ